MASPGSGWQQGARVWLQVPGSIDQANASPQYLSFTLSTVREPLSTQPGAPVVYRPVFKASNGWTAGADATVAVGKIGANGSVDTETMKQAVSSFILTNVGLEAGASVGAAKVTRISL